jgi:signal transduction histidine kinase
MYWTLRTVPLAALRDSHARQREEIERRLSAELELRAAQMQLADADRLESVGRLAAGVAHEVKNPLAIIRLGIDYLSHQAPTDDETHHAVLEDIRDAVGRADRIIKDLLNFSRTRTQSRTSLDLNAIVQNALRMTRHDLEIRRINVQCSLQDPLPTMTGDGEQLLQVFINLLVNAAQAIDHDGQISVSTRSIRNAASRADDGAANDQTEWANEVVITDTGPGLPDGVGDEIYEPFFTTKAPGEGTGLGLAVARNIVSWHGGTLTLQNNVDRGATALVTIKLVQESENEADTRS